MSDEYSDVRDAFDHAETFRPDGYDQDPRTPQDGGPFAPPCDPDEALANECALFPLNDFGNGKRFKGYFGSECLFVPRVSWFVWEGRLWAQDDDQLEVRRFAQNVSAKISREAQYIRLEEWEEMQVEAGDQAREEVAEIKPTAPSKRTDEQKARLRDLQKVVDRADDLKKKLASLRRGHHSHAKAAGNTSPINNMMREAQVDLYQPLTRLNEDPLMINTETCVLRFRVELDPRTQKKKVIRDVLDHARDQYLSKMMAVEFDPEATCPEFEKFLCSIQPDLELREFLQRWFGYCLSGLTTEQKLCFFYGEGRNGKSTIVDLIAKMMAAYATTVPIESLAGSDQRKGSDATPDLVRLPGARMVRAAEPERGQKLKEGFIKAITGGEEILVRRMQQEFVEVTPEFKLTISGNHKPEIRGTDKGIWRRVLLVPFLVSIPDEDVDALLPQKLWAERVGILNWLLEGLGKWLESGLMVPQEILDATEEYREESDPMLVFVNTCCIVDGDPNVFTRSRDLIDAFNWWYVDAGKGDAWTSKTVSKHFSDKSKFHKTPEGKGFTAAKVSDTGYRGIRLSPEFIQLREDAQANAKYSMRGPDPVM
jgi:putative DNA primase/helicase